MSDFSEHAADDTADTADIAESTLLCHNSEPIPDILLHCSQLTTIYAGPFTFLVELWSRKRSRCGLRQLPLLLQTPFSLPCTPLLFHPWAYSFLGDDGAWACNRHWWRSPPSAHPSTLHNHGSNAALGDTHFVNSTSSLPHKSAYHDFQAQASSLPLSRGWILDTVIRPPRTGELGSPTPKFLAQIPTTTPAKNSHPRHRFPFPTTTTSTRRHARSQGSLRSSPRPCSLI